MADGDLYISNHIGTVRTVSSGGTVIPGVPSYPTIADGEHWLVHVVVYRTYEAILNDADGPYMRALECWFEVQDNGTNIKYTASPTITVLKAAVAGDNTDTFDVDYVGGLRVWANASGTEARRWWSYVTIYRGLHALTSP